MKSGAFLSSWWKIKNCINCIFFQELFFIFQRIYLTSIIFGKVPLRHKSSEVLCDSLSACGRLWWRVAAVYGISLDCCSKINRYKQADCLGTTAETVIVIAFSTMLIDSYLKELCIFHRRDCGPLGPWLHSSWSGRPAKLSGRVRVWDFCCKRGLKWIQTNTICPLLNDNLIDALTEMVCIHFHPLQLLKHLLRGQQITWISDLWPELDLSGESKDWRNNVGFGS